MNTRTFEEFWHSEFLAGSESPQSRKLAETAYLAGQESMVSVVKHPPRSEQLGGDVNEEDLQQGMEKMRQAFPAKIDYNPAVNLIIAKINAATKICEATLACDGFQELYNTSRDYLIQQFKS